MQVAPTCSQVEHGRMDHDGLGHLLRWVQHGVVARRQLYEYGAADVDIARMVRRRELVRVHRGVYVNHTGPLTDDQRAWVAVLVHWPAALCHDSALPHARLGPVIDVAIAESRVVPVVAGVRTHRMAHLTDRVNWNATPPTVRPEHAVLDVMIAASGVEAKFRILAEAVQTRTVWPALLRTALQSRVRVPGRDLIGALIDDVDSGSHSVLERQFEKLERSHALPRGSRQSPDTVDGKAAYRDVTYPDYRVVVELDGRAFHQSPRARDADATRDLAAATAGSLPIRLTYGQVFRDGCATARRLGEIFLARGWDGRVRRCPHCPDTAMP